MNAEQLKAALLQQAIEGKLVPQLDKEPPVEQIGEAPKDVPFAIPEKWKWEKLGNVFSLKAGKFISASEIFSDGYPYLCYGGNGVRGVVDKYNREGRFPLIGRQGALCGNINIASGKFYATEHAVVADSNGLIDVDCAAFFLEKLNLNQYATKTAQPGLSVKKISETPFPVPPIEEQRRIVEKLNALLPLVEEYGKAYDRLTRINKEFPSQLKASLLQRAIEGKLVPQLEEEPSVEQIGEVPKDIPFAIPEKWKWVKLSSVGKIVGGGTPKTAIAEYWGGKIPWITPADLGKNKSKRISVGAKSITELGLNESSAKLMPKGSIVYSSRAPIGYIAITDNSLCTNQGCKSLVPDVSCIDAEFAYFCLIARTDDIKARASGTTFKEISGREMGETAVPLPPLAEQRRIVEKLNALLPLVDQMSA